MITIESTRMTCDSCDELKEGKLILVYNPESFHQTMYNLQLCNECFDNLKYLTGGE